MATLLCIRRRDYWGGIRRFKASIGSNGYNGDILLVGKDGADIREPSELTLKLEDTPPGGALGRN